MKMGRTYKATGTDYIKTENEMVGTGKGIFLIFANLLVILDFIKNNKLEMEEINNKETEMVWEQTYKSH